MDGDGLPELSDKEANAIATYIAYVDKYKEGLKTNNGGLIQLAKDLEQKIILDIKVSWDRKSYGIGYKGL